MRGRALFFVWAAAAAGAAGAWTPPGRALEPAVVRLGFRTNQGGPVLPECSAACANETVWAGALPFVAGSRGRLAVEPRAPADVALSRYASDLGCTLDAWGDEALAGLPGGGDEALQVFLLPAAAGGGACARFEAAGAGTPQRCRLWGRGVPSAGAWARALGDCLGLQAVSLPGGGCDPADFLCAGAPFGGPLLPVHLAALGWRAPLPLLSGGDWLPPGALLARDAREGNGGLLYVYLAGEPARVHAAQPAAGGGLQRLAALAGGERVELPGAGAALSAGEVTPLGAAIDAEFCARAPGAFRAELGRTVRRGAFLRANITLFLENRDRHCPPRAARAALGAAGRACNEIAVEIVPDVNPLEASFSLYDSAGALLLAGGAGVATAVVCGPAGEALTAVFSDAGGDGFCCRFGGGSFYSVRVGGTQVARGGEFGSTDAVSFPNALAWDFGALDAGAGRTARAEAAAEADDAGQGLVAGLADAGWAATPLSFQLGARRPERFPSPAEFWGLVGLGGGLLLALAAGVAARRRR